MGNFSITEVQVGTLIRGIISRSDTIAKFAAYKKTIGALGGALISMIDTWLGGGDLGDVLISGTIGGAMGAIGVGVGGKIAPLLCKIKWLGPVLGALGLGLEVKGIKESIDNKEYDQAAFRVFLCLFTLRALTQAWKTRACFTEETLIYTRDGYKQIKDIQIGDEVYSEDVETGEQGLQRVKQVFIRKVTVLVHLVIEDVEINTTVDHPFWVVDRGWIHASKLQIGDEVILYSGKQEKITSITQEVLTQPIKVYNFEVEAWHTYFVSPNNVLVHNATYGDLQGQVDLEQRAKEIHGKLDDYAQTKRTTAVLEVLNPDDGSLSYIVASSEPNLSHAQIDLLGPNEFEALGIGHAEETAINLAISNGQIPLRIGVSRRICPKCEGLIKALDIFTNTPFKGYKK